MAYPGFFSVSEGKPRRPPHQAGRELRHDLSQIIAHGHGLRSGQHDPKLGPAERRAAQIPAAHRRRLRTTNGLERLNKEIKRRTRVATLFPNEASLLRLASAVLSEISDDWETERAYLTMEAR